MMEIAKKKKKFDVNLYSLSQIHNKKPLIRVFAINDSVGIQPQWNPLRARDFLIKFLNCKIHNQIIPLFRCVFKGLSVRRSVRLSVGHVFYHYYHYYHYWETRNKQNTRTHLMSELSQPCFGIWRTLTASPPGLHPQLYTLLYFTRSLIRLSILLTILM